VEVKNEFAKKIMYILHHRSINDIQNNDQSNCESNQMFKNLTYEQQMLKLYQDNI
jgi:uncharacterized protein YjdB